jgi:hypothetical protein
VSLGQRGGSRTVVNLGFLDRSRYFSYKERLSYPYEAALTPFQTQWTSENLGIERRFIPEKQTDLGVLRGKVQVGSRTTHNCRHKHTHIHEKQRWELLKKYIRSFQHCFSFLVSAKNNTSHEVGYHSVAIVHIGHSMYLERNKLLQKIGRVHRDGDTPQGVRDTCD